jgi:lipid II:glycine glycyltransferase (peptidoglycan interpeptide bridge formation enzyme)
MDLPSFMAMADKFTDKIHCFAVYSPSSSSMIASSICISINSDVLYVFYWGDVQNDNSYSPITFLASYIYDYAKENLYKVIDVGTSSINSEPIYGLINFKRNLGFKESLKLTLEFLGEAEK